MIGFGNFGVVHKNLLWREQTLLKKMVGKLLCAMVYLIARYNYGYTKVMKTAISIPDQVFDAAEALARRLGVSRSELYAKAVEAFIAQHRSQGVTARLDAVYSSENNSLDDTFYDLQLRSIDTDNRQEDW